MAATGSVQIETVVARLGELEAACSRLSEENAQLRERLCALTNPAPAPVRGTGGGVAGGRGGDGGPAVISRRNALGKALGAAAVTVVGTAAVVDRTAGTAFASNGSNVVAGGATTAEGRTSVVYDGASSFPGVVLLGNDSTYGGQLVNYPAALGGIAGAGATEGKGGVANGIYGFTDNGSGNGVVGYNSGEVAGSGAGVLGLAFAAENVAVAGHNTQGTAVSGTSDSAAANATAVLGLISSSSPGGFSCAVKGQNNGTGGLGIGVWGLQAGSGWGVYGSSSGGIGVNAAGGTGTGVNAAGATGVVATGATVGLDASGPTAVDAKGGTVGVAATGPTAVTATGSAVGVTATGSTAVGATGTAVGVQASGPVAVAAVGTTTGLAASGPTGVSATGTATGLTAVGPRAISATASGSSGVALLANSDGVTATIHATNAGSGPALVALSGGGSGTAGTGAVLGDSRAVSGVTGLSTAAAGVAGHSKNSRGGIFSGGAAQLKLVPGSLASHPVSGEQGDIYLDSSGNLWFCKHGGVHATWKLIA